MKTIQLLLVFVIVIQLARQEQVYTNWQQCAFDQNNGNGYECFDEENECSNNQYNIAGVVPSTGIFYNSECVSQMSFVKNCLNKCKSLNGEPAKNCISSCKTSIVTNNVAAGYINCWKNCVDNYSIYYKIQPKSADNAIYDSCLSGEGSLCNATYIACMQNSQCKQFYDQMFQDIISCCLNDGRYDHYTDAWEDIEINILQSCIHSSYGRSYQNTAEYILAQQTFRCYLDCTIVNNDYYINKNTLLLTQENCLVNGCSRNLANKCQINTCQAPAYSANICMRMQRGIFNLESAYTEPNINILLNKCVYNISTMPQQYTQSFADCVKMFQECPYQNEVFEDAHSSLLYLSKILIIILLFIYI